jgi:hypothetical protein
MPIAVVPFQLRTAHPLTFLILGCRISGQSGPGSVNNWRSLAVPLRHYFRYRLDDRQRFFVSRLLMVGGAIALWIDRQMTQPF